VIPRFTGTIDYINQELDEMEKEEFSRLKKVLEKKRIIVELEKKEMEKKMLEKEKQDRALNKISEKSGDENTDDNDDSDDDGGILLKI